MAPALVAIASAKRACLILGSLPFSSSILALLATPISVPSVSNMSTKRNEHIITIKSINIKTLKVKALSKCQADSCDIKASP